jgi:DHA1 family bicyclomycin/chloramphenicol resistance-like MFS transporter
VERLVVERSAGGDRAHTLSTARDTIESRLSPVEFTALVSMIMAVTALAIDMMLPAFGVMKPDFGLDESSNALAPIVTFFLVGLGAGQLLWGPLSDALGRKRILYAGLAVYVVAAIGAALAPSLPVLFAVRLLGGIGAAGPRVVALGLVRDVYEGEAMAKAMSYIMAVFIAVPIVAPTLGSVVLALGSWQLIFLGMALFGIAVAAWSLRLPETLPPERRLPLQLGRLIAAAVFVVRNRLTMGLTLSRTAVFGFFASYLASSQVIIDQVFDLDAWFPIIFGGSAAVIGAGMLVNTRLLAIIPLRRLLRLIAFGYVAATSIFAIIAWTTGGTPSFAWFLVGLLPILLCHALLIPNFHAAAMIPMGDVAGTASAVTGTIGTLGGALLGALIDASFDGTIIPLATAGLIGSTVALLIYIQADRAWDSSVTRETSTDA